VFREFDDLVDENDEEVKIIVKKKTMTFDEGKQGKEKKHKKR
jgi:hypothetical protein